MVGEFNIHIDDASCSFAFVKGIIFKNCPPGANKHPLNATLPSLTLIEYSVKLTVYSESVL